MSSKYKDYFNRMIEANKDAFESFRNIHDQYGLDEDAHQDEFNKAGEKILPVIHEWENKLCMQSEKAGYSGYTSGLAEKFQAEVKKEFPLIDHIGIVIEKFSLKQIKLQ